MFYNFLKGISNKYIKSKFKRGSTLLAIRKKHIYIWYDFPPTRMTKIKHIGNFNFWQRYEATETLIYLWLTCKMHKSGYSYKTNIHLSSVPDITCLGIYPRKMKTYVTKKIENICQLYMDVYNSFICKSLKFETTQMFINRRMDKLVYL